MNLPAFFASLHGVRLMEFAVLVAAGLLALVVLIVWVAGDRPEDL